MGVQMSAVIARYVSALSLKLGSPGVLPILLIYNYETARGASTGAAGVLLCCDKALTFDFKSVVPS